MKKSVCMKENDPLIHTDYCEGFFPYSFRGEVNSNSLVRIDISDTGTGISESEQAKIFARFYRSKSVREQEGVGIGLYLARQIISGEGGYIKVASVPGKGSTFSIFLPK